MGRHLDRVTHHSLSAYLVMVQISRYLITSWATHDASDTLTAPSERRYPDSTLQLRCNAKQCYMNVTQIYYAWYRPWPCRPTSLELLQSRTMPHAKMYPYTDDTLQHRILYVVCICLYVVVQVQPDIQHHDKNQHV